MYRMDDLMKGVVAKDPWTMGTLARMIDDDLPEKDAVLARLHTMGGNSRVVGITGPPGAGKSTLISGLISLCRERGLSVAVLAADPTSPYSGGAVLGDRVRMQDHGTDPGVFIRSLATRGHMGGLTGSVQDLITLFDAAGFDRIVLETVGIGQEEVEVKDIAQTVVFVTVPGLGNGIQAMKAGVLEIAHIYVVNKADKPLAEETVSDLQVMVSMSEESLPWVPPVLTSVATEGTGIIQVQDEIDGHFNYLKASGGLSEWRHAMAAAKVTRLIEERVHESLRNAIAGDSHDFESDIKRVSRKEEDPGSVARRWLAKLEFNTD